MVDLLSRLPAADCLTAPGVRSINATYKQWHRADDGAASGYIAIPAHHPMDSPLTVQHDGGSIRLWSCFSSWVRGSQKLCHRVVDGLCGREPPCRGDYSTTWSLEEWLELLNSLTAVFRLAVGNDSSDEVVQAGLSGVGSSHAEAVLSVLRARREEIRRALLDRTNSISSGTLQDFDWQLKLALSSDKISSLHTPLLSLSLDVRENRTLRSVTMEMNREELNTLIGSLEAANKVVLQLK